MECWRGCGNTSMCVEVALVPTYVRNSGVLQGAARVGVEVGAPIVRPLVAVPCIETVIVLDVHNAGLPMMVDVNMIEADVTVIKVVMPAPTKWPPPRVTPGSQPLACSESKAETNAPVIGKSDSKSISAGPADPLISDVRRVRPPRAIDYDVLRADVRAEIAGRITDVNDVRR